jgi:hypothetical protein
MKKSESAAFIKGLAFAACVFAYPIVYLYNQNAQLLEIHSMWGALQVAVPAGVVVYLLFYALRRKAAPAANSAVVVTVFFYIYGAVFDYLLKLDRVYIAHFNLLPIFLAVGIFTAWSVGSMRRRMSESLHDILFYVVLGLMVLNGIGIAPVELQKAQSRTGPQVLGEHTAASPAVGKTYPDVYYIVLDEFASFNVMREYWNNHDVDHFEAFLEESGFFVATDSRVEVPDTLHEMARRLNMKHYPYKTDIQTLFEAITNNKVMSVFKTYGYQTVVFDGVELMLSSKPPVKADYNMRFDPAAARLQETGVDEFQTMVLDLSMARAFSSLYQKTQFFEKHRQFTLYSLEKPAQLTEVDSPKFVYAHVMLPHYPFLFAENGSTNDYKNFYNWNYYLGQYKFTQKKTEALIRDLITNADPDNPPSIILQSDHGPRNLEVSRPEAVQLSNFDEEYAKSVLNAVLLPGYNTTRLPKDLDTAEVFAIIFSHYFGETVP